MTEDATNSNETPDKPSVSWLQMVSQIVPDAAQMQVVPAKEGVIYRPLNKPVPKPLIDLPTVKDTSSNVTTAGKTVAYSSPAASSFITYKQPPMTKEEALFKQLTPSQLEILPHLLANESYEDIGNTFGIALGSVGAQASHIMQRLKVPNHARLVRLGIDAGLVPLPTGNDLQRLVDNYGTLSPPERIIMQMTANGKRQEDIATAINVSLRSFHRLRTNIMTKMGLKTNNSHEMVIAYVAIKEALANAPAAPDGAGPATQNWTGKNQSSKGTEHGGGRA